MGAEFVKQLVQRRRAALHRDPQSLASSERADAQGAGQGPRRGHSSILRTVLLGSSPRRSPRNASQQPPARCPADPRSCSTSFQQYRSPSRSAALGRLRGGVPAGMGNKTATRCVAASGLPQRALFGDVRADKAMPARPWPLFSKVRTLRSSVINNWPLFWRPRRHSAA